MKTIILLLSLVLTWCGTAVAEQSYGQSDMYPEIYVKTNGQIQVRHNIKAITITDMDGKPRTVYAFDYLHIPKLDQTELEKAAKPSVIEELAKKPLVLGIEKVVGYNGMDKAAYEEKFNSAEAVEKP